MGMEPAASRPGARMFLQRLQVYEQWQPLQAPHTQTTNCRDGAVLVGLHRGKGVAPRQQRE